MVFTIQITGTRTDRHNASLDRRAGLEEPETGETNHTNLHIQPRNAAFPGPASPGGGIQAVRFCIHTSPSAH